MFLRKNKRPDGRIHLAICRSFRDPVSKKAKQKVVLKLGYLDELEKEFDDPIAHFEALAATMTEEENEDKKFTLTLNRTAELDVGTNDLKNIGFAALSKIYHELGIHTFLLNRERGLKAKHPLNNIMKLLVYDRILHPASKRSSYENRGSYIENFDFPQESLYRALDVFAKHKDTLLLELHENVRLRYGRDTSNVFYDVTNYYFHTEDETELIAKGFSKDRKGKPIVQMGMLLDRKGLPMTYELFRGNTTDFETLLPVLDKVKQTFRLKRAIVVADKGLNSGENKAYNLIKGDGYIFSRSLRGTKANKEAKEYALDPNGYVRLSEEYQMKSRVYPTEITVENIHGKKVKVTVDEKHIVFYSDVYARRARYKRNEILAKAQALISSPSRYAKAENYGALKYIKGMKLDKTTGELTPEKKNVIPTLDYDLIEEEEKLDGYYSIVTSELDMPDHEVIENYKGLWKIEESFKITKTLLKSRPVYVKTDAHIEAHFLTCFLALLILRILEMKLHGKHSTEKMVESLKKANVVFLNENHYKNTYYDEVLRDISEALDIKMNREYLSLGDIRTLIADTKQGK